MQAASAVTIIVLIAFCAQTNARDYNKAFNFLREFGYLESDKSASQMSEAEIRESIREPLKKMKEFYSLSSDDDLDEETEKWMEKPRCSERDDEPTRKKRFALLLDGRYTWKDNMPISIGFKNYWNGPISQTEQQELAMECASIWASKAHLSFRLAKPGEIGNIHIEFVYIDGPANSVGSGLSPTPFNNPPSSYLKLDKSEKFKPRDTSPGQGVSLLAAICHEMGHTLSMGHSHAREAVMFPSLGFGKDGELHSDDIKGIQKLYGPRKPSSPPGIPEGLALPKSAGPKLAAAPERKSTTPPQKEEGQMQARPTTLPPKPKTPAPKDTTRRGQRQQKTQRSATRESAGKSSNDTPCRGTTRQVRACRKKKAASNTRTRQQGSSRPHQTRRRSNNKRRRRQ